MRRVLLAASLLLAAVHVAGGPPVSAQQPSPSSAQAGAQPPATGPGPDGITNFSRVDSTVACGGATPASAFPLLAAEGFKSVVNLRLPGEPGVEGEQQAVEAAGLRYIHLPLDGTQPDPAVADKFLDVMADPAVTPVYIHCASANRVGAMWAIKRVAQDGWTRERALEEAKAIGLKSPGLVEYVHRVLDARR